MSSLPFMTITWSVVDFQKSPHEVISGQTLSQINDIIKEDPILLSGSVHKPFDMFLATPTITYQFLFTIPLLLLYSIKQITVRHQTSSAEEEKQHTEKLL